VLTADRAQGVLAIWNDVRDGRHSEFEFWFKSEHLPERLAVPGFKLGRRFEAVSGAPRYFCYYLTESPDVLYSAAYIERLNNPTPLTRSIMSDGFYNMSRTICRRIERFGASSGAFCVTVRFHSAIGHSAILPMLDELAGADGIARCELWSAVDRRTDIAVEESLRGGDRKIAACAIVETLRLSDADRVHEKLGSEFGPSAEIGIYQLLCQLSKD
jgi:hypothetical protein